MAQTNPGVPGSGGRRKRKSVGQCLELLLGQEIADTDTRQALSRMGISEKEMRNSMALALALFRKAAGGDLSATKTLLELMGESRDTPGGGNVVIHIVDDLK